MSETEDVRIDKIVLTIGEEKRSFTITQAKELIELAAILTDAIFKLVLDNNKLNSTNSAI